VTAAQAHSFGNTVGRVIGYLVALAAALYIVAYVVIAIYRMRYPFELEWIEGGFVDQVRLLASGQQMYVEPSVEFVPFLYTPLYFYVAALATKIFGAGFFPLRLVSFLASLAAMAAIFLVVRRETRRPLAALLSAGLFLAAFRVTGAWLDIGRVDSLFLALYLFFIYFVRLRQWRFSAVVAGLLVALAFLTKQTAIVACIPLIAFLLIRDWRRATVLAAVALAIVGVITLVFDRASNGWYTFYTIDLLAQQQEWRPELFVPFWMKDLWSHLPVAILLSLFFLLSLVHKKDWPELGEWTAILVGALATSFLARVKQGGYENVLLPAYAVLAIFFGLGLAHLLNLVARLRNNYRVLAEIAIYLACGVQFALLYYNPVDQVPTRADAETGQKFVQWLAATEGEVYLPFHGYLPALAGKKTYAHHSAVWDIMRGTGDTEGERILREKFAAASREQVFDRVVLDVEWSYLPKLDQNYVPSGKVLEDESGFYQVTGWQIRPTFVYIPKRTACAEGTLPTEQCPQPVDQN
jgi:4-amino-4-deoxy-L-arabinose transferase-like glycosyltransferase